MAETQSAPKVSNLPRTSLHESDVKFITETVKVISNIDGANEMKVRVHDKLPSVFSVTVNKPPKMTPDDLNQLQMLNNRLRKIKFDFESNRLILESWKFKKDPQTKKRRREAEYFHNNETLPSKYNLDMVDKMDIPHVSGIILYMIDSTEIEFNIKIHTEASAYNLIFTQLEVFEIGLIELMIKKYGAFISSIGFNFPNKQLELKIRRNDCPLDKITSVRVRKKVKLI
tara:strand:+ start:370 stop:1053 length:684 start_codon:yes stop_codon:yes gene_type:complete